MTIILKIPETKREQVIKMFREAGIEYEEAGYPDGKVEIIETYKSKINYE